MRLVPLLVTTLLQICELPLENRMKKRLSFIQIKLLKKLKSFYFELALKLVPLSMINFWR